MSEIKRTKDYSIFRIHENNRPIDPVHLRRVKASIQSNNLLEFRPLLCDANMFILDGQHRYLAAKELGLELFYQQNDTSNPEDVILLNANQKKWTLNDYINFYYTQGKPEYIKLVEFCKRHAAKPELSFAFLKDTYVELGMKIRVGTYKHFTEEQEREMEGWLKVYENSMDIIKRYVFPHIRLVNSQKLQRAIFRLLRNPAFNIDLFYRKLTTRIDTVRVCTDTNAYYNMFLEIYNYHNTNKLE